MRFSTIATIATSVLSLVSAAPLTLKKRSSRWDYASEKLYGVNIGGWLVLEPFITPSLFEAFGSGDVPADEYHYCKSLGSDEASSRLQDHWSSWITEDDFEQIASYGLNFVRIPIGYWAFRTLDSDPYVQGQADYLEKAVGWAQNHGLKVWIDLHGAPGSQNGFDNSGLRDVLDWQSDDSNIELTLDVLNDIASKYAGSEYEDVVIGIELLNEPLGPSLDLTKLAEFYNNGYDVVRNNGNVPVIIQDAFQSDNYWDDTLNTQSNSSIYDVVVDHHHYQVFSTGELQRSLDEHISTACSWGWSEGNEYHWNLCGEFSAALTDCAKWLNGANRGARYDSTYLGGEYVGSCDGFFTADTSSFTGDNWTKYRKYVEAQLDAFTHSKVAGWAFWCWKTENTIEWDFKQLVELEIIPQPFTGRYFYNQCGFDQW